MNYDDIYEKLRNRKQKETLDKIAHNGYMDEDDYGSILPPEDLKIPIEFNDPVNKTFYGARLWGKNFRTLLEHHPVCIDPESIIAGRWMYILQRLRPFESAVSNKNMEMAPIFDYTRLKPIHEKYDILPGIGKMHHFAGDYRIGLELGWGGLMDKVRHYAELYPEQSELYEAEIDTLCGIRDWMSRTVAELERLVNTADDPLQKDRLTQMLEANRRLITDPPRTYLEACQWIAWNNMAERIYCRAGAGGQLDTLLQPYYERDLAAGIIDRDQAVYIMACLLLNDPHYYQVAGPDEMGKDQTCEMSFIILEAAHKLKISCNVTVRVHDGLEQNLFDYAIRMLLEDRKACPRFSGDKALVEGFARNGYSKELARKRIAVGCNWMSLPGLEYTMNDLIKINLAKVFSVAYLESDAVNTKDLFDQFVRHLHIAVNCVAEGVDFHLENQHRNAPELMLNLSSHGPIERGLDASNGGVDYYNIAVDGSGLGTVADSFAALEYYVDRERIFPWEEIRKAVRENFAGPENEKIRIALVNGPRYGAGNSLGDVWAKRIASCFSETIHNTRTPKGRLLIPGLFSWANTVMFGKSVPATPNGRFATKPISHGANPNPGFRKDSALTALSNAIASVQQGFGNTAPFQLELDPSFVALKDAPVLLKAMILSHFDEGGTLLNVNIVDKEELLAANEHPENYPDLIVRVTGFTAYFAALSPEFRQIVVDRVINS